MDEDKNPLKAIEAIPLDTIYLKDFNFIDLAAVKYEDIHTSAEDKAVISFMDPIIATFECVVEATSKMFEELRKLVNTIVKGLTKAKTHDKAYIRSQRNNQYVKRYKHGRTQKTRVKRK